MQCEEYLCYSHTLSYVRIVISVRMEMYVRIVTSDLTHPWSIPIAAYPARSGTTQAHPASGRSTPCPRAAIHSTASLRVFAPRTTAAAQSLSLGALPLAQLLRQTRCGPPEKKMTKMAMVLVWGALSERRIAHPASRCRDVHATCVCRQAQQ